MPEERHTYHRVVPYIFILIDADEKKGGINIFKTSYPKKFQKVFKIFPIIPLYGDMRVEVMLVLQQCHHWEDEMESQWENRKKMRLERNYELTYHRDAIRAEYRQRLCEFTTLLNEVKVYQQLSKTITPEMLEKIFTCILSCLKALSNWSAKVIEQSSWKFANPLDIETLKKISKSKGLSSETLHKGHEYESVVSYNYSDAELHVLIDVIGMIKGLGGIMMKYEFLFVPLLRRFIHDEFQNFLQQELARPLRKAHKRKRQEVKDVMLQMREIGADWLELGNKNDFEHKKAELATYNRDYPRRATAPTYTQIVLVRRMCQWIYSPRAEGMKGGFMKEKDLKKEWIPRWEAFDNASYFYQYLLNYHQTVRLLTDMSHLWYREFYLEMTQCVQFPIRMSMPWIMTDYLIRTPSMKENMFFPMDIYNDAGSRALVTLHQQFLYDEVEAECDLSFMQLIFHLSIDVFKFYKTVASSALIDQAYRSTYQTMKPSAGRLTNSRYVALCSQRQINLLGRSVDLKLLITEHVNLYMRDNIEYAIKKFTSQGLTSVIQLKMLLDNARLAHKLLTMHIPLDPWEDMFKEMNSDVSVSSFRGRIVLHIFSELVADVMSDFTYNSGTERFIRSRHHWVDRPDRGRPPRGVAPHFWFGKSFNQCFERHAALSKGFFGVEHIEAIVELLGVEELPLLIHEVLYHLENKLLYDFGPYVTVLTGAIPPGIKLPATQFGVIGGYGLFDLKLGNSIASYPELRSGAFQYLREIGNTLIFIQLLEKVLNKKKDFSFNFTAFFAGMRPHPTQASNKDFSTAPETPFINGPPCQPFLTVISETLQIAQSMTGVVDATHVANVYKSAINAAEVHCYEGVQQQSLFTATMMHLKQSVNKHVAEEWRGRVPDEGHVVEIENPGDFARLFSALLFIFCQAPSKQFPDDDLEAFGVGFLWGGCSILHLMGLTRRFAMLDFTYHVLKLDFLSPLERVDQIAKKKKKKEAAAPAADQHMITFLKNAKWVKAMNEKIGVSLESYFPSSEAKFDPITPPSARDPSSSQFIRAGTARIGAGSPRPDFATSVQPPANAPGVPPTAPPPSGPPGPPGPPGAPPLGPPTGPPADPNADPTSMFGAPPPRPGE